MTVLSYVQFLRIFFGVMLWQSSLTFIEFELRLIQSFVRSWFWPATYDPRPIALNCFLFVNIMCCHWLWPILYEGMNFIKFWFLVWVSYFQHNYHGEQLFYTLDVYNINVQVAIRKADTFVSNLPNNIDSLIVCSFVEISVNNAVCDTLQKLELCFMLINSFI